LATDEEAGSIAVSLAELEYIEGYANHAGNIISKAFDSKDQIAQIIEG
jgi:hypothetical protein